MNMHILAARARLHAVRNGIDDVGRREVGQLGYFSIMMTSFERHSTGRPLFTGRFVKGRASRDRLVSLFDLVAYNLLPPYRQRTGNSNRYRRRSFTGQINLPARPFGPRRRRRCRRRSCHSMVEAQTGSSFLDGFPVSPTCFFRSLSNTRGWPNR